MLTFFIDRSIDSKLFTEPLKTFAIFVELHRDHFVHDEDDDVWIKAVAARDWIIVTADERTAFNEVEKQAIINAKAKVLHLSMGR